MKTMADYELLGKFYLGREYDLDAGKPRGDLVLYDSKDLTTHAVCVGMTGSGKTGLCLTLLEEAAIDNIPVIAIDPKGDIGNLLLTFPELRPEDFRPWIDEGEAARKGVSPDEFAKNTADQWRKGLAEWGQPPERIAKFRASVDLAIYTPGSSAGLPLSVLRSFSPPPKAVLDDNEAMRDRLQAAVAGLLGLAGIESDPMTGRENILLSNILEKSWRGGDELDFGGLLRAVQSPQFDKIGFMDLETFFPAAERFKLAMQLNNLFASPGFSAWLEGEPLDVGRLFHTAEGKPRISIVSIAHLSESERMFFVTLLLNEVVAWVRSQSGTSSLRAILYMDEVFGYFPPTANPPSKKPMLTLLKQARAFGVGVVLATQNPVDLDYKGLSNAGTWFLGRLQTERDKARVLEGLEGASAAAGASFDRGEMERILSRLGNRVFLLHNVHEDRPEVFQTRWAMSYLRGPLSRDQIAKLMADQKRREIAKEEKDGDGATEGLGSQSTGGIRSAVTSASAHRPVLPPEIREFFMPHRASTSRGGLVYRPALLGRGKVHFASATAGIDHWQEFALLAEGEESTSSDVWTKSEAIDSDALELEATPESGASFGELPDAMAKAKSYSTWTTALKNHLYGSQSLSLFKATEPKATSQPGESERDFRIRLSQKARERRDEAIEKLRAKYETKLVTEGEKLRRAKQRKEKEEAQASQSTWAAAGTVLSSLAGALLGRKKVSAVNVGRAATAARAASRAAQQRGDVAQAEETVEAVQDRIAELESKLKSDLEKLDLATAPESFSIERVELRPKKADISVEPVALVWAGEK
jgi:uncharacterized protein DUF87